MVRKAVDFAVYLVVRALLCVIQAMTIEAGQRLARWLAWLLADVLKVRGKVVDENLRHAFPDFSEAQRRDICRGMWEHLLVMGIEIAHAPRKIHETNWRQFVELNGIQPLQREIISKRPVVIVTAHFGNFELGGYVLGLLGFPTFTVARDLDNPYIHRWIERFRKATGQRIIPKNGGFDQILGALQAGGTMTLLADQYAGPKGCWVQFFNRPASAHKAIGLLSLEHDAPIAICSVRRLDQPLKFEMKLWALLDPRDVTARISSIKDLTQWYTSKLEEMIREAPEQYWWLHRRWKDPRPPKKSSLAKAA